MKNRNIGRGHPLPLKPNNTIMKKSIRLNIETKDEQRVIEEFKIASSTFIAQLVMRVSPDIVEIELSSTEPRAISLENIKDILYWIPDYKIRFSIG